MRGDGLAYKRHEVERYWKFLLHSILCQRYIYRPTVQVSGIAQRVLKRTDNRTAFHWSKSRSSCNFHSLPALQPSIHLDLHCVYGGIPSQPYGRGGMYHWTRWLSLRTMLLMDSSYDIGIITGSISCGKEVCRAEVAATVSCRHPNDLTQTCTACTDGDMRGSSFTVGW